MDVLPPTPAGKRTAWVWRRVLAIDAGTAAVPSRSEFEEHYGHEWLDEVAMDESFARMASLAKVMRDAHVEPAPVDEVRLVVDLADDAARRLRCVVEPAAPHRIVFQVFSPAMATGSFVDRVIERDGRRVHVRDFGGDGPLLLLWHGAGVDATIWEAVIPHLTSFRVVAQDLPGHGRSSTPRLSVADAIAADDAVSTDLRLGQPILAGFSLGGLGRAALRGDAPVPCAGVPRRSDEPGLRGHGPSIEPSWLPA